MSALSAASSPDRSAVAETAGAAARARARASRRLLVNALRIAFAVVVLAAWEIGTAIDPAHPDGLLIDPFNYGRPSAIARFRQAQPDRSR